MAYTSSPMDGRSIQTLAAIDTLCEHTEFPQEVIDISEKTGAVICLLHNHPNVNKDGDALVFDPMEKNQEELRQLHHLNLAMEDNSTATTSSYMRASEIQDLVGQGRLIAIDFMISKRDGSDEAIKLYPVGFLDVSHTPLDASSQDQYGKCVSSLFAAASALQSEGLHQKYGVSIYTPGDKSNEVEVTGCDTVQHLNLLSDRHTAPDNPPVSTRYTPNSSQFLSTFCQKRITTICVTKHSHCRGTYNSQGEQLSHARVPTSHPKYPKPTGHTKLLNDE